MGDLGSIPGLGRSLGEGNSSPLQYSGLENSVDRGAWQATVHGVAKGVINNHEEASNSQSEEHLLNNWSIVFQSLSVIIGRETLRNCLRLKEIKRHGPQKEF